MKVVHISTYKDGGAGIAAYRIHSALLHSGIDSSFLIKWPSEISSEYEATYQCEPYYPLSYKISKKLGIANDDLYNKKIKKYSNNFNIATLPIAPFRVEDHPLVKEADIVHLHWVADFINYPTFFKNIKQPIVWTLHDINPLKGIFHFVYDQINNSQHMGDLDKKALSIKIESIQAKQDIHICCPSKWMANNVANSLTLKKYPCHIIPNSLDLLNNPVLDKREAKREIGLTEGLKTFLLIGTDLSNKAKGYPIAISALNHIKEKFNLITVGQNTDNITLNSNIHHFHFQNISNISILNQIYSATDLTILPSLEDNLPNVMLESFINGTPVVSFTNGGMAEHINTGENGILVNTINEENLQNAIVDFLNGKYCFDNSEIRKYAIDTFAQEIQIKKYIQLYREILDK